MCAVKWRSKEKVVPGGEGREGGRSGKRERKEDEVWRRKMERKEGRRRKGKG